MKEEEEEGWRMGKEAVEVVSEGAGEQNVFVGGWWLEADSDSLCFLSARA